MVGIVRVLGLQKELAVFCEGFNHQLVTYPYKGTLRVESCLQEDFR